MAGLSDDGSAYHGSARGVGAVLPGSESRAGNPARNVDDSPLPAGVQRLQKALLRDYLRAKDDMDPEMMPEGVKPTVENIQVNLVMLPRHGLRQEFTGQTFSSHGDVWRVEHVFAAAADSIETVELRSLFPSVADSAPKDTETVGVLAVASAGCGKTFVFTLVAPWKWATGQMWGEFDIVVARALRCEDVRGAKGLVELLALDRCGIAMDGDRQCICDYVSEHPERVCIILDGLDETCLRDCSEFVQRVISGQTLEGVRIIVTSRPCADVFALSQTSQFQHRVELVGFRPADLETYVRKVLRSGEAEALLVEVGKDKQLASMMATPFFAKETCRLYHHDRVVPRCVADLFERMIVRVASLRARQSYKSWSVIPAKIRKLVLDLGGFAFDMLMKQRLIFTEADIQKHALSEDAIALGLLVACDPSWKDSSNQWRFSHLTMQESLAAKYQVCCKPMTVGRVVRLVEGLGPLSGHLRMFWILLAARLNKACAECLVNSLLTRKKSRDWQAADMDDNEFCLSDPFPLNYIGPLCEVMRGSQPHRLAEELLSEMTGSRSAEDFVEDAMKPSSRSSNVHFLYTLLTTWMDMDSEADEVKLVAAIERTGRELASHCTGSVHDHRITRGPREPGGTRDEKAARRQLALLCFAEYSLHHTTSCSPLPSIEASLSEWDQLFDPVSINGADQPALCRAFDAVLQHHPHALKRVQLRGFCSTSPCQLPLSLRDCSGITELSVSDCVGQWDTISTMVRSSSATLQAVDVRESPASDADMAQFLQPLSMCHVLQDLSLHSSDLSQSSGIAVADAVARTPSLQCFIISGSRRLGDAAATQLCEALVGCSEMLALGLGDCGLSAAALPGISAALRQLKNLVKLYVHDNDFSAATAAQASEFIAAINSHRRLCFLNLTQHKGTAELSQFDSMMRSYTRRQGLDIQW